MALSPSKLQKLKITAYENQQRTRAPSSFTVMFNPQSLSMRHENKSIKRHGHGTKGSAEQYAYTRPAALTLELILDGTGVTGYGPSTPPVAAQVKQFMDLCFHMDGKIHEPKYLRIQWGKGELANFDCRLQSVDIKYNLFDRNGEPLNATLTTAFVADVESGKRVRSEQKSSPDVSHARTVKSGDTLPLLTKEIYGSSRYYLRVAEVNGIDDFRNLTPGQQIVFPPLAAQDD